MLKLFLIFFHGKSLSLPVQFADFRVVDISLSEGITDDYLPRARLAVILFENRVCSSFERVIYLRIIFEAMERQRLLK